MSSGALKRIRKDVEEIRRDPSQLYFALPLEDDFFQWHFCMRGPPGTDFEGGVYHGRIILPTDFPFKAPHIMLLTPNGRFELRKKICLSITGYHNETWQPAWGVRLILEALISFFPDPGKGAIGSLDYTPKERKRLAKESLSWKAPSWGNEEVWEWAEEAIKSPLTEEDMKNSTKYASEIAQITERSSTKTAAPPSPAAVPVPAPAAPAPAPAPAPALAAAPASVIRAAAPAPPRQQEKEKDPDMLLYFIYALVVGILALMARKMLKNNMPAGN